jgi:outer membrane protein assembly factor BamE (lipoprotein component of BamABCDE complex)
MELRRTFFIAVAAVCLLGCASNRPRLVYVEAHPELDPEIKRRIIAGEAVEGMTAEQVVASLGGPKGIERTADGFEYWDYPSMVLRFKDGQLVSWIHKKHLY